MGQKRQSTTVSQSEFEAGPSKKRIMSVMKSQADADIALHSSSTSLPGGEYEVFLSFRGPDTRLTFTDFLYTNLHSVGVRTFRDNNELRKGEEIGPELLKAITESKISIPIFSKNYASSKWCLVELAQMVDCKRGAGQRILPIFYDVEPSEVRHQSGSYEKALGEHKSCFHESTVKKWKEAMREVGALKGWEVKKEANGHQGELVKMIVHTVLLELKKNYMVLTKNLVGIGDHINEMMRLLKVGSSDARIVGIHGMGGIGKTTIAKCIYNKFVKDFECCSFLADIRETAQHKGLVTLQKKLLNDTLKWCLDIADVNSGISAIKHQFLEKKALIVLDDVSEKSQFDWLVGNSNWFGPGSRIIVTTRDKHVLNALEADEAYEPTFMNFRHSLELLSIHAFRKKFPPIDYENISKEVASTTAGLPLALEVIGSFLSDKTKAVWEDTLNKLKKIPANQVQKKLRISYDELNYEQQQIFLDIACLFIGTNKTYPFYMWDDCSYYPEKEISVLCLMSLVKIENDNMLIMHDQLRDLGREIVRQEDINNAGMRSRLWHQEEALDVFEGCMGTEKVQLLSLDVDGETCEHYKFKKLINLRYLQVDGAELVGDFKHHLLRLRWLRWQYCPWDFKATNFHMKKLVILDLSNSCITEDWNGWSQIKMANKLKVLNISHTEIAKLPDEIWMLEMLEIIDASHSSLKGNIPICIGRLSSLRHLSFNSTRIRSLPKSICKLSCLQTLHLEDCTYLEELPELPSSLEILNVSSYDLRVTPNFANVVNLQVLRFCYEFDHLEKFSTDIDQIYQSSKLQRLDMRYTPAIRTLPKGFEILSRRQMLDKRYSNNRTWLKILTIESCHDIPWILDLPSNLVELYIDGCRSLEISPDLSNLKFLLKLTLRRCYNLTEIQGLGKLESLTSLTIDACIKLTEIQGLGKLESVASLKIHYCPKLKEVEGLGNLESLESFVISSCYKIAELNLLKCSASLSSSKMSEYKHLENKPDPTNLNKLKNFEVSACMNLNKIQGLDRLVSLEYLNLGGCQSIARLPNLSNLKRLRNLLLNGCTRLHEIEGLEDLEALEELNIAECSSLEGVPHLPNTHIQIGENQIFSDISDDSRFDISDDSNDSDEEFH